MALTSFQLGDLETINAIKIAEQSPNYTYIVQYKHALNCSACTDNNCSYMKSKLLHSSSCHKKDCLDCYDINFLGVANRIYEGLLAKMQLLKQTQVPFTEQCHFIGGSGATTSFQTSSSAFSSPQLRYPAPKIASSAVDKLNNSQFAPTLFSQSGFQDSCGPNRLGKNGKPNSRYQFRNPYNCQICKQVKYKGHPCTKMSSSKSIFKSFCMPIKQRAAQKSLGNQIIIKPSYSGY